MSEAGTDRHVVIIGASLAGTRTAQNLRTLGHTGPITLIGAESELPYDRPPLSKDLLKSDWSEDAVESYRLLTPAELEGLDLDLRLGLAATGLDTDGRRVSLADGTEIAYDVLVIATGATARPSPWQPAVRRAAAAHARRLPQRSPRASPRGSASSSSAAGSSAPRSPPPRSASAARSRSSIPSPSR